MTRRDETARAGRLVALHDLSDYKVANNDPDIRGWDVVTADRRRIGRVHDLIVDPSTLRVRYLDVELAREFHGGRDARHVLLPIEKARLDEESDDVLVDPIASSELEALPDFEHQEIDADYENRVWLALGAGRESAHAAGIAAGDGRFFGSRRRGREHSPYFTKHATTDREVAPPLTTEPAPDGPPRPATGGASSPLSDEDPPRSRR